MTKPSYHPHFEESVVDITLSLLALLPLVLANLFADRLTNFSPDRQLRLKSFAGGLAAAYVFLHVLPKLAYQQELLERTASDWLLVEYLYHHAYVVALAGFVTYYLVNALAQATDVSVPRDTRGVVTVAAFGAYMALMGDLIATQESRGLPLALFSMALTLHLLGLNLAVYGRLSRSWKWLRPLLSMFLFLGWLVGAASAIPAAMHALVSAWLAGGIIILVVLHELPKQRRPGSFCAGALTFAALLKLNLYLTGVEGGV